MTELKLTRPTAAGCLASFHQLTSTHWNLVTSLIVYAAKGPCAECLSSLSVCLLECLSLVFFRYEPHIFSCWLSELVAPPFEFKQAAVAPWTRYEEGLWRERPTPINTCVWRKLAVEKRVKSAGRCQGRESKQSKKLKQSHLLYFSKTLCLIVFQNKMKQIFNLILKPKEQHLFFAEITMHSFQPFSFNHLPPFCFATPTFHYPVNSQWTELNFLIEYPVPFPEKKIDCRSGLQPLDNLVLAH